MGLFDFFHQLLSPATRATRFTGLNEIFREEKPHLDPGPTPALVIPPPDVCETIPAPVVTALGPDLPHRAGTFLVVDLYPGDLGGKPNWRALEANSKVGNCEVVGAILKATEGTSYRYTSWFTRNGAQLRDLWQGRLGRDRFMGAYHFLQLGGDPVKQAEFFVRTMDTIHMPQGGVDLVPMLDFEQGGQRNFWPTDCPKDEDGHYQLEKLPLSIRRDLIKRAMDTTRECAEHIRAMTGWQPMLYGRGLQRDLGMTLANGYTRTQLHMGCRGVVNPAYTRTMPTMEPYGIMLDEIGLWQYGGDGKAAHPTLPASIPGFGAVDLSVHIDGARRTTLDSFRRDLVCA